MKKRIIDMGGVTLSPLQKKLVNQCLNNNRLSYGPMTQKFEAEWAKMHQVKYALFCNSGTSALQVALHALKEKYEWEDDSEVIMPATTFVATMNVILHNNLKPVFVDVETAHANIDPDLIEKAITSKTKAIVVVHLLGVSADMDPIMKIAKKHNLKIIEDSCETVGVTYKGKSVGSFGDVSCFSTYASHLVVTGVGGFACTNNKDLAVRIKGLYNHGRDGIYHSIDDDDKDSVKMIGNRFNFTHSGYSYRATELEAALGIGHLKRFKEELKRRKKIAKLYNLGLVDSKADIFVEENDHSYMLYKFVVKKEIKRDALIKYLEKHGVMTRFIMPLLNQPIVKKLFGNIVDKYPVSKMLIERGFLIGCHPGLTNEDVKYTIKTIKDGIKEQHG